MQYVFAALTETNGTSNSFSLIMCIYRNYIQNGVVPISQSVKKIIDERIFCHSLKNTDYCCIYDDAQTEVFHILETNIFPVYLAQMKPENNSKYKLCRAILIGKNISIYF